MEEQKEIVTGAIRNISQYWDLGLSFLLASFFGFIRYLQDILDPATSNKFKWFVALAKGLTAGSVGLLTYWLLQEWTISKSLSAFLIGIAGYGGAETLQAFKEGAFNALRNMLGKAGEAPRRDAKD